MRRGWAIEQVTGSPRPLGCPSASDARQAAGSRRLLYQKAYAAFRTHEAIEANDPQGIVDVLSQTLVGPLEDWRRFELLTAFQIAEALSAVTAREVEVRPILPGSDAPVLCVGPFDVFWQSRSAHYVEPEAEESETRGIAILEAYGLGEGGDRPDVVVCHRDARRVAAIAGAKFYRMGEVSAR